MKHYPCRQPDELGNRVGRKGWSYHEHTGRECDTSNRSDVADEIEIRGFVKYRIDDVRGGDHKQRVAVRRGAQHGICADAAAGSRSVLDNERLAQPPREPLSDQARENVGPAANSLSHDHADGSIG